MTPPLPPGPPVEHLQGPDALSRVAETLARFEPAVLLTADGRGAIYAAPDGGERREGRFWLLADARTALDWEADRRHEVSLTFHSRDERVYLKVSGVARPVLEPGPAAAVWRQSFRRWFPGGPGDPRLLLLYFTASSAEYVESASGPIGPIGPIVH